MLIKMVPARMPSSHPNTNNWKIKLSSNSVGNSAKGLAHATGVHG